MLGGDQWSKYTTNESEIVDYRKHTEQLHRSPEENL